MVLSNKPQVYTHFGSETQHLDIPPPPLLVTFPPDRPLLSSSQLLPEAQQPSSTGYPSLVPASRPGLPHSVFTAPFSELSCSSLPTPGMGHVFHSLFMVSVGKAKTTAHHSRSWSSVLSEDRFPG